MFNLTEINEAHAKVKGGVDFPNYIQELIKLGVKNYNTNVINGQIIYLGDDEYEVKSKRQYLPLRIANISDKDRFKHYLKNHQRGQTDYSTFCSNCAETGVKKWIVDMNEMTCTYYDKANNKMLEEQISTPQ